MPQLAKKVLSQFLLTGCMRRLRFTLYPKKKEQHAAAERARQGIPDPLDPRPGFGELTRQGKEWEREVYRDLVETIDPEYVIISGEATPEDLETGRCFGEQQLVNVINNLRAGQLVVEPQFSFSKTFKNRFNLHELERAILQPRGELLDFADVRPDLIQVTQRPEHRIWYACQRGRILTCDKTCESTETVPCQGATPLAFP